MRQRPSYDKISQPMDCNGRQCWWCGPKIKGKYEPPQYLCHKLSIWKRKDFHILTYKDNMIMTIQASINETKLCGYKSE